MDIKNVKANALMNYLIRKIGVICQNPARYVFVITIFIQVFIYENNSLTQKRKTKIKRLNSKFQKADLVLIDFLEKYEKFYF